MLVRDVMTPDPVTIGANDTLYAAAEHMHRHNCRRLPVLDEQSRLIGILTDRDLRLAANSPLILRERWQDEMLLQHTTVDACMTPNPITTPPDAPLEAAIGLMLRHKISGLPVVAAERLIGIVTVTDLLRALQTLLGAHE